MLIVQKYGGTSLQDAGRLLIDLGSPGDHFIRCLPLGRYQGRGGSDTTAAALAAALKADRCQIFTDVDGIYDRDPRRYADAQKYDRIGYGEMLRLVGHGAQVLHDRSVETARDAGITLEVLSALRDGPGTLVGPME